MLHGTKRQAKIKAEEVAKEFEEELNTPKETTEYKGCNILFGEYMKEWLNRIKRSYWII